MPNTCHVSIRQLTEEEQRVDDGALSSPSTVASALSPTAYRDRNTTATTTSRSTDSGELPSPVSQRQDERLPDQSLRTPIHRVPKGATFLRESTKRIGTR